MYSNKKTARTFGLFFLFAFIAYGGGSGLVDSIVTAKTGLPGIYAHKNQLIFGVILMSLVHTFLNIGLATIMLPLLKPFNRTIAYGYYSAAIAATVMLIVGGIFLFLEIPLSEEYVHAGIGNVSHLQTLSVLFVKANFFAYQVGMAIWGLGGLMFCYLLYRSKLVPKALPVWGFIGYLIFISGTIFELFGYKIGLLLDIPGGLFEIFLSFWLIVKGFSSSKLDITRHYSIS